MKFSILWRATLSGLIMIMSAGPAFGAVSNLAVEASLSGGSTSNLYSERGAQYCQFRSLAVDLDYSLFSFAQVNLAGDYTYYRPISNLSSLGYRSGVTLIPTSEASRINLFLTGNVGDREYRDIETDSSAINANEFTGLEHDAMLGIGYALTPSIQLRTSISFNSVGYGIDGVIDQEAVEAAVGSNLTLFGRYSLDIELGYSAGKYQHISQTQEPWPGFVVPRIAINEGEQYDILLEAYLKSLYFSPRLSTTIGSKTGLSLSYMVRNFQNLDRTHIVYGYSSGWLSPWNNLYEGQAVVFNLKTFLIPRFIVSLDVGYWDKTYLRAAETELWQSGPILREGVRLDMAGDRSDYRSRTGITFRMPLAHADGYFLEPSLTIDYTDNKSTVSVHDYTDLSVTVGMTVRF